MPRKDFRTNDRLDETQARIDRMRADIEGLKDQLRAYRAELAGHVHLSKGSHAITSQPGDEPPKGPGVETERMFKHWER